MMTHSDIEFDVREGHITFWQGARAHRRDAVRRALVTSAVLCVAFGAIFAADYVFAFMGKGLEYNLLFFVSLGLMSALLGFALGLSRYARTEKWTLDRIGQELRVERMMFGKSGRTEAIDLKHVRALRASAGELEAVLDDALRIRLVSAHRNESMAALIAALRTFIQKHGLRLDLQEEHLQA